MVYVSVLHRGRESVTLGNESKHHPLAGPLPRHFHTSRHARYGNQGTAVDFLIKAFKVLPLLPVVSFFFQRIFHLS
jgi:hypothetical protein